MKGDFSRIRFNSGKQYNSVLKQQGRVDLDADANEQCFIDQAIRRKTSLDVIGPYGGPEDDAGFEITIAHNGMITIGPGRYYVEGILVENPRPIGYDQQPYLLGSSSAHDLLEQLLHASPGATLGFVLEVWQRLVTGLDDPCLLEPALGQADTTARLQTVWRVTGTVNDPSNETGSTPGPIAELSPCCQALYGRNDWLPVRLKGEMGASLAQGGNDCGCQPVAPAGYQGQENQLYRVEIHHGGDLSSATFKWSRENASVVTAVTAVSVNSPTITVADLGPDANLGFQPGGWVELSDDTYQFGDTPNQPGPLFQIQSVNATALQVTMATPVFGIDVTKNARMRRWEQLGSSATSSGIPVSSTPIALENGIEVEFRDGAFAPGDYWTFAARTASGSIDWPPCGGSGKHFQSPDFIKLHRAPLACVRSRNDYTYGELKTNPNLKQEGRFFVSDCRLLFPPLTAVNAAPVTSALRVKSITWTNDDVMTVDQLIRNGVAVTFDGATTCPWGGGNFQVTIEPALGPAAAQSVGGVQFASLNFANYTAPSGTDVILRTMFALDPPKGITASGNTVTWLQPVTSASTATSWAEGFWFLLNILLGSKTPNGYARMRIRLIGGAVYGSGAHGNLYLDGQSLGKTGIRASDSSQAVNYIVPSGTSFKASDYEGWFYLAPTVVITNVVIQGMTNGMEQQVTALKVIVNSNNQVTSLQTGETATVTNLQAAITLSYPPVSDTVVTLMFTGTGAGTVISIASSITIPAGQKTATTPINVLSNPGGGVTDTVTLVASVSSAFMTLPADVQPTLSIAGMTPPFNLR